MERGARNQNGRTSRRISLPFALLMNKRKPSGTSPESATLVELEEYIDDALSTSTPVRRPLQDTREQVMSELRELFIYETTPGDLALMEDDKWILIRDNMEFFPVRVFSV